MLDIALAQQTVLQPGPGASSAAISALLLSKQRSLDTMEPPVSKCWQAARASKRAVDESYSHCLRAMPKGSRLREDRG